MKDSISHDGYRADLYRKASGGSPALYLVKNRQGSVIGMLEKYKSSKHEQHPWKAIAGYGMRPRFLGATYAPNGMLRALQAVIDGKELPDDYDQYY